MSVSAFDCLAVTQVNVFPFREGPDMGKTKGLASVVLNDQVVIRGLRIVAGENGLYVGYPNDPFFKGEECRSVVFPLTRQLREHIENCVLEKYHAEVDPRCDWEVVVRHPELDKVELTIQVKAENANSADILACNKAHEMMPNLMMTAWEVKTREKLT